ncbi:MAG: hypothetical protein QNJ54_27255 [Prochloraceae cyanobacterium]|nr:hypothetical protein [Prochloraceae cyanobacterium]
MAKLTEEILTSCFILQRQILNQIDEAAYIELRLFEQFGETQETIPFLEELESAREKLTVRYSRLNTLLVKIAQSQPTATIAMLNLLEQTLEEVQVSADASYASIAEVKKYWNL